MSRKASKWQKHIAPFMSRAVKQARKSYKPITGLTPAKLRTIKSLQKKRDAMNKSIRKLKGKEK